MRVIKPLSIQQHYIDIRVKELEEEMSGFDFKVGKLDDVQWGLYVQLKEYIQDNFSLDEMLELVDYKGKYSVHPSCIEAANYLIEDLVDEDEDWEEVAIQKKVVKKKTGKKKAAKKKATKKKKR